MANLDILRLARQHSRMHVMSPAILVLLGVTAVELGGLAPAEYRTKKLVRIELPTLVL